MKIMEKLRVVSLRSRLLPLLILVSVWGIGCMDASAQKAKKAAGSVYVFGVGYDLNDTIVYVTAVQEVKDLDLEKKTKFLPYRAEFSLQLKQYLEGTRGLLNQTTSIFFSDKRSKVLKRYMKLRKRILDTGKQDLRPIADADFQFALPAPVFEAHAAQPTDAPVKEASK